MWAVSTWAGYIGWVCAVCIVLEGSMNRIIVSLLIALFSMPSGHAAEKEVVCAKYRADYGWSKGHKVEASILKGSELNSATKTFSYNILSTYVVIFWARDQASIIEMGWPYLSAIGQEGEDQRGMKWEIAKTSICF